MLCAAFAAVSLSESDDVEYSSAAGLAVEGGAAAAAGGGAGAGAGSGFLVYGESSGRGSSVLGGAPFLGVATPDCVAFGPTAALWLR